MEHQRLARFVAFLVRYSSRDWFGDIRAVRTRESARYINLFTNVVMITLPSVSPPGFEPGTKSLKGSCSTAELRTRILLCKITLNLEQRTKNKFLTIALWLIAIC